MQARRRAGHRALDDVARAAPRPVDAMGAQALKVNKWGETETIQAAAGASRSGWRRDRQLEQRRPHDYVVGGEPVILVERADGNVTAAVRSLDENPVAGPVIEASSSSGGGSNPARQQSDAGSRKATSTTPTPQEGHPHAHPEAPLDVPGPPPANSAMHVRRPERAHYDILSLRSSDEKVARRSSGTYPPRELRAPLSFAKWRGGGTVLEVSERQPPTSPTRTRQPRPPRIRRRYSNAATTPSRQIPAISPWPCARPASRPASRPPGCRSAPSP